MSDSIEWLRLLIVNHRSLEYIIIFLGTAIGGEIALFALGFLVAHGVLTLIPLGIFSFLGSFTPNILWFLLGETETIDRIIMHRYANTTISMINEAVTRVSSGNHFIALTIIKFLVGTPPLLVMYVHKTKLKFGQFLYYETPAIALSVFVIITIGAVAGFGFTYLSGIFHNIYIAIGFILLVVIIITMVQTWFKKKFTSMEN